MSPHGKAQLGRLVRLAVITLASSAFIVNMIKTWEVRYPLLAVLVGMLEVAYREFIPVTPLPSVTSVPAPKDPPVAPPQGGGGG